MADLLLLTGATGFIGHRVFPRLVADGWSVRCLSRRPETARQSWPDRDWVRGDADDPEALARAMAGCRVAFYLIHGMADLKQDWVGREIATAERFAQVAARAGVERIIYLGGVAPAGEPSAHLRARLETGRALRAGAVPCLELRAAMIVGAGSASWTIVRDLAARLPFMVLPAWLSHRSEPVAVDSVVAALVRATRLPLPVSDLWDLPGPEALSGVEILKRVAACMGRRPLLLNIPFVTPKLSSHWIRLVTRTEHRLAAELVEGLTSDLLAARPGFWAMAGLPAPLCLEAAARLALAEEAGQLTPGARTLEALAGALMRRAKP
jgi:uncharacterized protein YbjT (DUF2867 family)